MRSREVLDWVGLYRELTVRALETENKRVTTYDGPMEQSKELKYLLEMIALERSSLYGQTKAELRALFSTNSTDHGILVHVLGAEHGVNLDLGSSTPPLFFFFLIWPSSLYLSCLLVLGAGIKFSNTPKWLTRKISSKTGEVTRWCVRSLSTGPCTRGRHKVFELICTLE